MTGPLMVVEILERWKEKVKKKLIFSLMTRPFTPPPPLNGRPLRDELFLEASLREATLYIFFVHFSFDDRMIFSLFLMVEGF